MIQSIPLKKLAASPRNVRKSSDVLADLQLRADIAARGLLQNLVVRKGKRGKFEVEAGGRRLAALQALAEEGTLPDTHEVTCLVIEGEESEVREASLAENFQRLAMNPADEAQAFAAIVEAGATTEDVARRFGLTVRFVEGRLRLASLAPCVFEALAEGTITLDMAKAYGAISDVERQAHVYAELQDAWYQITPDTIRRMVLDATVRGSDPRAVLVGRDAYLAAGGRIERELFDDDASESWIDVALLEDLAHKAMEEAAEKTAIEYGLAWVRLDDAPANDPSGYAGIRDRVDAHGWQLVKGVALSTLLGVGTALGSGSDESDLVRAMREAAQQGGARAGDRLVERSLDIRPTIVVRPGWPVRVIVHKDFILEPWRP